MGSVDVGVGDGAPSLTLRVMMKLAAVDVGDGAPSLTLRATIVCFGLRLFASGYDGNTQPGTVVRPEVTPTRAEFRVYLVAWMTSSPYPPQSASMVDDHPPTAGFAMTPSSANVARPPNCKALVCAAARCTGWFGSQRLAHLAANLASRDLYPSGTTTADLLTTTSLERVGETFSIRLGSIIGRLVWCGNRTHGFQALFWGTQPVCAGNRPN
jgi:hypothetical protein